MTETLLFTAIQAAYQAGLKIMEVYATDFLVEYKEDLTPLTYADKLAHQEIVNNLEKFGIPILSEEGATIPFDERINWKSFWLVDPLDGTKEFVKRNGDFTVNIALIEGDSPIAGVIYAPVPDLIYFGIPGHGAFRTVGKLIGQANIKSIPDIIRSSVKLPMAQPRESFVVVASRSHQNAETSAYIKQATMNIANVTYLEKGSSLKFCSLAEGSANLYPRLSPTMEWDTAAGHAIALHAGCHVLEFESGAPLRYNKKSLLNQWFIVSRMEKSVTANIR